MTRFTNAIDKLKELGWPERVIERLKQRAPALQEHKQIYDRFLDSTRGAMSNIAEIREETRRHIETLDEIYSRMGAGLGHLKESEYDATYNALMHDITFIINLQTISAYDPTVLAQVTEWAEADTIERAAGKISPEKRAILLAALEQLQEEP